MPRPRTWNDETLQDAVRRATSWKEVCVALGVPVGGKTVQSLRARASDLAIDCTHLYGGGRRGSGERPTSDAHLRRLVAESVSWSDLGRRLGYKTLPRGRLAIQLATRVSELDLSTAHFRRRGFNGLDRVSAEPPVFTIDPDPKRLRFAAVGKAIAWFAERGHVVSTPVEPAVYDLVVDAGVSGLYRVQVKSSASPTRTVGFARTSYNKARPSTRSGGYMRRAPYEPGDIDYFFAVLLDGSMYLLPYEVIGRRTSAVLGGRYDEFKIA